MVHVQIHHPNLNGAPKSNNIGCVTPVTPHNPMYPFFILLALVCTVFGAKLLYIHIVHDGLQQSKRYKCRQLLLVKGHQYTKLNKHVIFISSWKLCQNLNGWKAKCSL